MKVGASYYPEVIDRAEWENDLRTGRDVGLSVLRCGEFAWSAFAPEAHRWEPQWAIDFLELAHQYGYDVIWCTPSATPPPYLFDRWPDLQGVNVDGHRVPVGVRRNYCPNHEGYLELCENTAARLAKDLAALPAVKGWQIDNEIAGDGFTCWCDTCRREFQQWLAKKYGTLKNLNRSWQTGVWSQAYTAWNQIPIPARPFGSHTPAIKLDYRRFRSDAWLRFYRRQAQALRKAGAETVTTNFYNYTWDIPFDQWAWRPHLDTLGISHYLEDENASRFQLALLNGPQPEEKRLWVLEQKAGQQATQNFFPENTGRIREHLQRCAEAGAEYAVYWHLRQHSAGCEMEHGAVLRHDGKATRIARAIQDAIADTENLPASVAGSETLLVFSFEQQWTCENRPHAASRWDYITEIEQNWFAGLRKAQGDTASVRVGPPTAVSEQKLVVAPFFQMHEWEDDQPLPSSFARCLEFGGTIITTCDFGRLDSFNNVKRLAPLDVLRPLAEKYRFELPQLEVLHLKKDYEVQGEIGGAEVAGKYFWAIGDQQDLTQLTGVDALGTLAGEGAEGPVALKFAIGNGILIVALTALDAAGVTALASTA